MVGVSRSLREATLQEPESGTVLHTHFKRKELCFVLQGLTGKQAHSESKTSFWGGSAGTCRDSWGRPVFEGSGQSW